MKKFAAYVEWKILLAIFKVKRLTQAILGMRTLDYADKNIRIHTTTLREYTTRAKSCAKEPETCAWIRALPKRGGVLYDIGANVGAYSLIAGAEGMRVIAFEPSPENYATLHRNIAANTLTNAVTALPFALGSTVSVTAFDAGDTSSGSTHGFVQGSQERGAPLPVFTLDACIRAFGLPAPTALKLDVDGGEGEVLRGATQTLQNKALTHLLVEVNEQTTKVVDALLTHAGFARQETYERGGGVYNTFYKRV